MEPIDLSEVSTPELLGRYAATLDELKRRGVIRTRNAPLGDYAEYLAATVYGGELAGNSAKSYDLLAPDGRRMQVKARAIGPGVASSAVFSAFRSFDFDTAVFLTFDLRTFDLVWAREVPVTEVKNAGRFSRHINARLLKITLVPALGTDVTSRFRTALGNVTTEP